MINTILSPIIGLALALTGFLGITDKANAPTQQFGSFSDPFVSVQLAPNPQNGNCLTTNGTDNAWSSSCGGGGSSQWATTTNTVGIYPAGASGVVIGGSATTTNTVLQVIGTTTSSSLGVGSTAIGNNVLKVSPLTGLDISASESVGGMLNANVSTSDEIAGVFYSNHSGGSRTVSIVANDPAYTGNALHVRSAGTKTAFNLAGAPQGQGLMKAASDGVGDANAAIVSTDASTGGFLGQLWFGKCGISATCWNMRDSNNAQLMTYTGFGYLGLGTTTPFTQIQIATSSRPQLSLTDPNAAAGFKHWVFRSNGGRLDIATSSDTFATSSASALSIDSNGNLYIKDLVSCDTIDTDASGQLSCGTDASGGGGDFPFTPTSWGVSTSTTLGFLNGFLSTASSTQSGNFFLPALSQGVLYTGTNGLVNTAASSSIFGFTPLSSYDAWTHGAAGLSATTSVIGIGSSTPWGMLSVTQTGTDPAFIVEDSASPDTSPFIINASGNVGIGTAAPVAKLDVRGQVATQNWLNIWNSSNVGTMTGGDGRAAITFGATDATNSWFFGQQGNAARATDKFGLYTWASNSWIQTWNPATGNVGIGTTNPVAKLDVYTGSPGMALDAFTGMALQSSTHQYLKFNSTANTQQALEFRVANVYEGGMSWEDGSRGNKLLLYSKGDIDFQGTSQSRMYIQNSGNVGIGTTGPIAKLNIKQSSDAIAGGLLLTESAGDYASGMYRQAGINGALILRSTSVDTVAITQGNVGIGTTTPNFKLVSTNSTGPQLSLSAGAGLNQWVMRNEGGELAIATSTYTATSSVSALRIDSNGWGVWQLLKSVAKLVIPFGANPTVNTQGEIAIDTTVASSSLAFYDGTAERRLYTDNTKSFFLSTSTLSSFNGTGTTTIEMKMAYRPTTIVAVSCKATTTGTAYLDFGDGTNWSNLVTCNTTGAYTNLSSNNTFVMGEMMKFRLGTIATLTQGFTISYVERQDAD